MQITKIKDLQRKLVRKDDLIKELQKKLVAVTLGEDDSGMVGATKRRNKMARDASQPLKMASEIGEPEYLEHGEENPHYLPSIE